MTDIPALPSFLIPLIRALREMGGIGRVKEVYEKVIENTGPYTSAQLAEQKQNGESVIENQIRWARFYLVRLGYIQSGTERGFWKLTQLGESVNLENSALIMKKYAEARKEYTLKSRLKRQQNNLPLPATQEDESEDFESAELLEQNEKEIESELLEKICALSPRNFEYFCKKLLRHEGFEEVEVTQESSDGGFDGKGKLVNSFIASKVIFECKRYKLGNAVPVEKIRALQGKVSQLQGGKEQISGVLITTGVFSKSGQEEAALGVSSVQLIDGEQLVELCKKHNIGLKERKEYDLDYQFFSKFKGDDE